MWWLPLLLAAGSMAANHQGQKKVDRSRSDAMRTARELRERKEKQTTASAKSTADLLINAAGDEKTRAAELEAEYVDPKGPAAPGGPMPRSVLDVLAPRTGATLELEDTLRDKAGGELSRQAHARAALRSYGDVMGGNMITARRNATDIDQANTATRNWMNNVLPSELEAANHRGDNWKTFADVLQLASMVTGVGAMTAPAASTANVGGSFAQMAPDAFGSAVQNYGAAATANLNLPGALAQTGARASPWMRWPAMTANLDLSRY